MSTEHEDQPTEETTEDTVPESAATPEDQAEDPERWRDRALRAQAEMANMRRRLDTEVELRTRRRLEGLLHDLITVGDHIELALAAIPEPVRAAEGADGFLLGMDAIRTAFDGVLRQHGLEVIHPAPDAPFDPAHHEAVQTDTEAGLEAPRLELMRRGFRLGSHVLRPAQVRIVQPEGAET